MLPRRTKSRAGKPVHSGGGWISLAAFLAVSLGSSAAGTAVAAPQSARGQIQGERADSKQVLALDQALDIAFSRNPALTAAAARIGEAEAKVQETVAAFYPKLTARVSYNYSDDPSQAFSYIVAQRRFNFGLDINHPGWVENFRPEIIGSWSLYRGGQDAARKRAAELGVEAAEFERSAIRNRLAAAVTAAYYALLAAPERIAVAERSIATVNSQLKLARDRVDEGTGLKTDVLSLDVRAAEAREAALRARNAVDVSRSALNLLLGGAAESGYVLRMVGESAQSASRNLETLLTEALAQRPEMQAAARQVEMRRAELDGERGGRLPRVNAYAAYGQNSRSPDFSFGRDNTTVGISAEVDLFSGGAVSARIAAAERRVEEAQALEERTRLEIEDELRRALANFVEAQERLKVAEASSASAEEALRLVQDQYQEGVATVTRYLETESDRAGAAMRAIVARYEANVASAAVRKALGEWR